MTIKVRRVVTGHDGMGRAVVKIDEVSKNIVSNRPGTWPAPAIASMARAAGIRRARAAAKAPRTL